MNKHKANKILRNRVEEVYGYIFDDESIDMCLGETAILVSDDTEIGSLVRISRIMDIIESMSREGDTETLNAVVVSFLEVVMDESGNSGLMVSMLGPSTKSLFDKYISS